MQMAHLFAGSAVELFLSTSDLTHDDAYWIEQNASFLSEDGKHCCGPGDCKRFDKAYFRRDDEAIYYLPTMQKFRLKGPAFIKARRMTGGVHFRMGKDTGRRVAASLSYLHFRSVSHSFRRWAV